MPVVTADHWFGLLLPMATPRRLRRWPVSQRGDLKVPYFSPKETHGKEEKKKKEEEKKKKKKRRRRKKRKEKEEKEKKKKEKRKKKERRKIK